MEDIDSVLIRTDENYLELIKDELNVREVLFEKATVAFDCELDTEITPELRAEGMKRELVRTINAMRKNAGLTINDRIKIYYQAEGELADVLVKIPEELKKDTLASDIVAELREGGKEYAIEGNKLVLFLEL